MPKERRLSPSPSSLPEHLKGRLVRLPRSAARKYRAQYSTYIKLIRRVSPKPYAYTFDGPILAPGALAKAETLGPRPVLVECAGPVERVRGSRHWEYLYILWRYDYEREEWIELGRARAADWTWVLALRELAIAALPPEGRRLVDVYRESERIADKVVGVLDEELEESVLPVRERSLWLVHGQVSGRIAAIDDEEFRDALVATGWTGVRA